ncbi:ATP-grasp fold amidoligase family protein [Georgenia sp. MJ206]|uniref:ATP-grasp fold amidoligase family protein n=1 Tax=Georgenia wangjunii TaxID=3117730 RepID=UPI002F263188
MYIERKAVRTPFRLLARLPVGPRRRLLYALYQRGWLRLRRPNTFSAKVNWRIVFDRRSILVAACDKEASKLIASTKAADLVRIPKTVWFGTDLASLAHVELPHRWVLKPNSGSGRAIFGSGSADVPAIIAHTHDWLEDDMNAIFGCWAYSQARSAFLVEEQIGDSDGRLLDYKVYCFGGVPHFVQVVDESGGRHAFAHYTPNWRRLETRMTGRGRISPETAEIQRPERLDDLLEAAARIAAPYDFMRVDFYIVNDELWFGEMTPYPSGGVSRFHPASHDEQFGALWTLPSSSLPAATRARPR